MGVFLIVSGVISGVSIITSVLLQCDLIGTEKETPKICLILLIVGIISGFIAAFGTIIYTY